MYCSRLSVLQGLLNEEKTKELSLPASTAEEIAEKEEKTEDLAIGIFHNVISYRTNKNYRIDGIKWCRSDNEFHFRNGSC